MLSIMAENSLLNRSKLSKSGGVAVVVVDISKPVCVFGRCISYCQAAEVFLWYGTEDKMQRASDMRTIIIRTG